MSKTSRSSLASIERWNKPEAPWHSDVLRLVEDDTAALLLSVDLIGVHQCPSALTIQIMNRFLNILIGWLAFACVIILGKTGGALGKRTQDQPMALEDYVFLGLAIASIFFLQYAVERYLIPPNVFTKEQRKGLLEGAEAWYRKTFFRGALGISYFFLVLYAWDYLGPHTFAHGRKGNLMIYSVFFLILGMLGRARGIILHLAGHERPIQASGSGTTG